MSTIRANLLLSFISTIIWTARSIYCDSKTTFFDILSNASWVPLKICLFIISAKIAKRPFTLMSHSTSIRVELFSIWLSVIVFLPFIGPSIISTLIDFLGSECYDLSAYRISEGYHYLPFDGVSFFANISYLLSAPPELRVPINI